MSEINKKTTISLDVVVILISVAFSFGIVWYKIDALEKGFTTMQTQIAQIQQSLTAKLAHNESNFTR